MHELSIATSIIEIVRDETAKAGSRKVTRVELEIGTMAGVETDALLFSWELVNKNTIAEEAPLLINVIQAMAECNECHTRFELDNFFTNCPSCESYLYEIFQGKELRVKAIVVE
jgi:hydrogenase nickel incorporation protein HypA/HybF